MWPDAIMPPRHLRAGLDPIPRAELRTNCCDDDVGFIAQDPWPTLLQQLGLRFLALVRVTVKNSVVTCEGLDQLCLPRRETCLQHIHRYMLATLEQEGDASGTLPQDLYIVGPRVPPGWYLIPEDDPEYFNFNALKGLPARQKRAVLFHVDDNMLMNFHVTPDGKCHPVVFYRPFYGYFWGDREPNVVQECVDVLSLVAGTETPAVSECGRFWPPGCMHIEMGVSWHRGDSPFECEGHMEEWTAPDDWDIRERPAGSSWSPPHDTLDDMASCDAGPGEAPPLPAPMIDGEPLTLPTAVSGSDAAAPPAGGCTTEQSTRTATPISQAVTAPALTPADEGLQHAPESHASRAPNPLETSADHSTKTDTDCAPDGMHLVAEGAADQEVDDIRRSVDQGLHERARRRELVKLAKLKSQMREFFGSMSTHESAAVVAQLREEFHTPKSKPGVMSHQQYIRHKGPRKLIDLKLEGSTQKANRAKRMRHGTTRDASAPSAAGSAEQQDDAPAKEVAGEGSAGHTSTTSATVALPQPQLTVARPGLASTPAPVAASAQSVPAAAPLLDEAAASRRARLPDPAPPAATIPREEPSASADPAPGGISATTTETTTSAAARATANTAADAIASTQPAPRGIAEATATTARATKVDRSWEWDANSCFLDNGFLEPLFQCIGAELDPHLGGRRVTAPYPCIDLLKHALQFRGTKKGNQLRTQFWADLAKQSYERRITRNEKKDEALACSKANKPLL